MSKYCSALLAGLLATLPVATWAAGSKPVYLLRPAAVFTAEDSHAHAGWVVRVEGQHIAAVGPAGEVTAPPDAKWWTCRA
jgi:hypothetical protein